MALSAAEVLPTLLERLRVHDYEGLEAECQRIDAFETEADRVRRNATAEIVKGAFFGGIREDVLNFMERVDTIADSAKDAGMVLVRRRLSEETVDFLFESPDLTLFVGSCVQTVLVLKEVVKSFAGTKKAVLERADQVERCEEEADSAKDRVIRRLYSEPSRFSILDTLQLERFVHVADNVADGAEDASDVALILLAKGYR